jgi:hypothetical protein
MKDWKGQKEGKIDENHERHDILRIGRQIRCQSIRSHHVKIPSKPFYQ